MNVYMYRRALHGISISIILYVKISHVMKIMYFMVVFFLFKYFILILVNYTEFTNHI